MTTEARETLSKVAGIIEGVACSIEATGASEALISALEKIDGILRGESDNVNHTV